MRLSLILLLLQLWGKCGSVEVSSSQNACSRLPDVPHAYMLEETKRAEYKLGNVIRFTCEIGYISGPTIRYACTDKGWFAIHKGPCILKPCSLPEDTPNGYYEIIHGEDFVFGTTIKYFCNEGFQMVSKNHTRVCLLNQWTNHAPVCDPLSCDPPPADGGVTVIGLPENDDPIFPDRFLKFSCDGPGKYLNGSSMLICGKDGQWDNPFPSCEDITCKVGVMDPHLSIVGLVGTPTETMPIGRKLQFQCDNLYTLKGPREIECLESGQWNSPFPTCSEKCEVTGVSSSVHLMTHVPNNELRRGQHLRFRCSRSDHFLHGNAVVECLANGQWSHPFPTCGSPVGCGRPPLLADGDTKESLQYQYEHNGRVEYICQNLYTMEGESYQTCINGKWTGQMRCVKPCTVTEEDMSRHNIAFRYKYEHKLYSAHNDIIEFKCTRGRHVDSVPMRQTCVDGEMPLPTCQ